MSGRRARVGPIGALKPLTYTDIVHAFTVRWLREARRVLKPDGTLWVSGTHHIIFSIGFALQRLEFRVINEILRRYKNQAPT